MRRPLTLADLIAEAERHHVRPDAVVFATWYEDGSRIDREDLWVTRSPGELVMHLHEEDHL